MANVSKSKDIALCPHCGAHVLLRRLAAHMSRRCPRRPEMGPPAAGPQVAAKKSHKSKGNRTLNRPAAVQEWQWGPQLFPWREDEIRSRANSRIAENAPLEPTVWVGRDCTCGGDNPDCWRCSGSGVLAVLPESPGTPDIRGQIDESYGKPRNYPWHLSENRIVTAAFRWRDGRFDGPVDRTDED